MRVTLLFFYFLTFSAAHAQQYLGEESSCLARYDSLARVAMEAEDRMLQSQYLNDSIQSCFVGERIPEGKLVTIDGDTVTVGKRDRPYVLYFTASWCGPCVSNSQALNVVMDSLAPPVDILVLSWDQPSYFAEHRADYHENLQLIPSRNGRNESSEVINGPLKHTLGFPSVYMVDTDQRIVGFQRGAAMPMELPDGRVISQEEALRQNVTRWVTKLAVLE